MGSAVIVEAQPGLQCSVAMCAGSLDSGICPLALERLDHAFGFAVGARPAFTDADGEMLRYIVRAKLARLN